MFSRKLFFSDVFLTTNSVACHFVKLTDVFLKFHTFINATYPRDGLMKYLKAEYLTSCRYLQLLYFSINVVKYNKLFENLQ